ncbi:MAG: alpha-amylase family glycosyl hydrolase [Promethearchaeota archaeon]
MVESNSKIFPRIIEINTWSWLNNLSQKCHTPITFQNIPIEDILEIVSDFDWVWFMGVWTRSPQSQKIARNHPGLQKEFQNALDDLTPDDIIGSPYAIYDYHVDPHLGGDVGLRRIIKELHTKGKKIILDFVPNHVAVDHPWLKLHPEYFIMEQKGKAKKEKREIVHGKDPYFPSWTDTAQLNAFSPEYRQETISTIYRMTKWGVDGVRCDMAMLMTNRVFQQTWKKYAVSPLGQEFWSEITTKIKKEFPNFLFMAEVYWDMEWELQQQGFNFCYDKRLYDRLIHSNNDEIYAHLTAPWEYQSKLVRFIENHDEPRALSSFGNLKSKSLAAATLVYTLPGAYLYHFGQKEGLTRKLPVQLARFQQEPLHNDLQQFYSRMHAFPILKYQYSSQLFSLNQNLPAWGMLEGLLPSIIGHYWATKSEIQIILTNYSDAKQEIHGAIQIRRGRIFDEFEHKEITFWLDSLTHFDLHPKKELKLEELKSGFHFDPWETLVLTRSDII